MIKLSIVCDKCNNSVDVELKKTIFSEESYSISENLNSNGKFKTEENNKFKTIQTHEDEVDIICRNCGETFTVST